MPRPRRFSEDYRPAQVAQMYDEGRSTRDLEAQVGLSRWVISRWCEERLVQMRSKDDALERQRYFASIEADRAEAARCCWPGCPLMSDDRQLCTSHWLDATEHEGRDCAIPRCPQDALRDDPVRLCDFHRRRAEGVFS